MADAFLKKKANLRAKLDLRQNEEKENLGKKVEKALDTPIDKHKLAQLRKDMRRKPNLANLNIDKDAATDYPGTVYEDSHADQYFPKNLKFSLGDLWETNVTLTTTPKVQGPQNR